MKNSDVITCNGTPLEFVNEFKYLGFIFQTSGRAFAKHIANRCRLGQLAMFSITKIPLLSLNTALKLFDLKISPIVTYGIQLIWPHLSLTDFRSLEKIKTLYLKRALCLSKYTKSRFTYKLAKCDFYVREIQIQMSLPETDAFKKFISEREVKATDINFEFYFTHAMLSDFWKVLNFSDRHLYTRFACHGFHFVLCTNIVFHECDVTCFCKFCGSECGQYHFLRCCNVPFKSLSQLAAHSSL